MRFLRSAALASIAIVLMAAAPGVPGSITSAIKDTTRPKADRDADAIRMPAATLAFAGVKPGMVVGELYPCGGYFGHMLSDVVGASGKVYGLETTRWKDCLPADEKMVASLPVKNYSVKGEGF